MMKVLTTTAMTANASRTDEMIVMNWSKSERDSSTCCSLVATSSSASKNGAASACTSSGMVASSARKAAVAVSSSAWIAACTTSRSAPSSTPTSIWSNRPSMSRNSWAVNRSKAEMLAPTDLFSSGDPKLTRPTRWKSRSPVGPLTAYVAPTVKPWSPAVRVSSTNSGTRSGSSSGPSRSGERPSTTKSCDSPGTSE